MDGEALASIKGYKRKVNFVFSIDYQLHNMYRRLSFEINNKLNPTKYEIDYYKISNIDMMVVSGDRRLIKPEIISKKVGKASIYANILVSPEGIGKLLSFSRGSSKFTKEHNKEIQDLLQTVLFNKTDHESTITMLFSFFE